MSPPHHIRDRSSLRPYTQPTLLPTSNRPFRLTTSRPRSFIHNPLLHPHSPNFADPKKHRPFFIRIPSVPVIISTLAFAFFVCGIILSSNISNVLVSPPSRDIPIPITHDKLASSSFLSSLYMSNISALSNSVPSVQNQPAQPPNHTNTQTHSPAQNPIVPQSLTSNFHHSVKPDAGKNIDGRINWTRSWPLAPHLDDTHVLPLENALNFDNTTILNYFHMHKTGGVTLKSELMAVVNNRENQAIATRRGYGLRYVETCYEVPRGSGDESIEGTWRCDFGNIKKMTNAQLRSVDIVMGHQYWNEGTEVVFAKHRKTHYFSIFRHPLPRKLSFFYHFFVRNIGRKEKNVGKDEIIKFLLGEEMPDDAGTRDAGPNYYASRMLSDGISGFTGHRYELDSQESEQAIANVISKLQNSYALVGLQIQHEASQCMLEKLIQVFAHARGIDDLVGTPKLSFHTAKLNRGKYPWTSKTIWKAMTDEQRKRYKKVERVDLAIYEKAVERFKEDVKLYSCEDQVKVEAYAEDIFEQNG